MKHVKKGSCSDQRGPFVSRSVALVSESGSWERSISTLRFMENTLPTMKVWLQLLEANLTIRIVQITIRGRSNVGVREPPSHQNQSVCIFCLGGRGHRCEMRCFQQRYDLLKLHSHAWSSGFFTSVNNFFGCFTSVNIFSDWTVMYNARYTPSLFIHACNEDLFCILCDHTFAFFTQRFRYLKTTDIGDWRLRIWYHHQMLFPRPY